MDVVAVVPLHSLLVIWCIPTWSASGTEKVSLVKFIGHRASAHLLIWVPEMLIEAIDYGTKLGYCGEWWSQEECGCGNRVSLSGRQAVLAL